MGTGTGQKKRVVAATLAPPRSIAKVQLASTVKFFDVGSEKTFVFTLVAHDEQAVDDGKISEESPVARALLGNTSDDEVEVMLPHGKTRTLKILGVQNA